MYVETGEVESTSMVYKRVKHAPTVANDTVLGRDTLACAGGFSRALSHTHTLCLFSLSFCLSFSVPSSHDLSLFLSLQRLSSLAVIPPSRLATLSCVSIASDHMIITARRHSPA